MKLLATIQRKTQHGKTSVWRFAVTDEGTYIAFGGCNPKMIVKYNRDDLFKLYSQYLDYGYQKVTLTKQVVDTDVKQEFKQVKRVAKSKPLNDRVPQAQGQLSLV